MEDYKLLCKITNFCGRLQALVKENKLLWRKQTVEDYKQWWKITDFCGKLQTVFEDYKMFWKI